MKMRFILSSCTLLLFALLAGGSFDGIIAMFWICLDVVVIMVIGTIIQSAAKSNNKKKRREMIKLEETTSEDFDDFDRSISFGNDRCMFYFDSTKRKVMIMKVSTEYIKKTVIDGFECSGKDFCRQNDPYFCIYDEKNRHLLCGNYENMDVVFENKDIAAEDKNCDITPHNSIRTELHTHGIPRGSIYTLVDECHGLIAIVRKGKVSSVFNYINKNRLLEKTGNKSYISSLNIGNYNFIMDDFFNVLVIVTPGSYELFNYSDIIEVSYEENGTQLYSKSAMRTVGGAIVGGVLMGEAGAVVGGLSGASKKTMEIRTIDVKILLRNTQRSTCILNFNDSRRVLKIKDNTDNIHYEVYQKNANRAKDILSVIIDKARQKPVSPIEQEMLHSAQHPSIADELAKLAKLKSEGILTEEEFNKQKAKLLNS